MFVERMAVVVTLGVLLASTARADLAPPPPPKGMKYAKAMIHKFTTESEIPDYDFYTLVTEPGDKRTVTRVELSPKSPVEWDRSKVHRRSIFKLTAVPKGAAKKYDTEKAFFAALHQGDGKGQLYTKDEFWRHPLVKETEKEPVEAVYTITKVNEKDGIVIPVTYERPKLPPGCEPDEDGSASALPRSGVWVAGLAVAAAFVTGGLWLTRRRVG